MSNLRTDSIKYQKFVKNRLVENKHKNWKPLWSYIEMTQLPSYGYSLILILKENTSKRKLLYREWRNNLNLENQIGIFNLDRIIIDEYELQFQLNEIFEIQELTSRQINILDEKFIILDGYIKEFKDYKWGKELNWNIDEQVNDNLKRLVDKIRKLKST